MHQMMVRYTVKAERVADNEALVRRVYNELHENAPEGLHYATFVLENGEDGVSFMHLVRFEGERDANPLFETAAFKAFQAGITERVDVPPAGTPLREVGSYRFWGA